VGRFWGYEAWGGVNISRKRVEDLLTNDRKAVYYIKRYIVYSLKKLDVSHNEA
jgi:hypothetical protein